MSDIRMKLRPALRVLPGSILQQASAAAMAELRFQMVLATAFGATIAHFA
jgi:hypothetical protein